MESANFPEHTEENIEIFREIKAVVDDKEDDEGNWPNLAHTVFSVYLFLQFLSQVFISYCLAYYDGNLN